MNTNQKSVIPSDSQKEYEKEMIIEHLLMEGITSTYKEAEEKAIAELSNLYSEKA